MAAPRVRAAVEAARTQSEARRAGGAWNRHDRSALHDALVVGMIVGLPDVKLEYGGLRFRFDLPGAKKDAHSVEQDVVVPVEAGDDVQMEAGEQASAPASEHAAAQPAAPAAQRFADGGRVDAAASNAAELERLRERDATLKARRKRQKDARKARAAEERELLAKYASLPYGDVGAPTRRCKAPLWSMQHRHRPEDGPHQARWRGDAALRGGGWASGPFNEGLRPLLCRRAL
jgi:hypothetical protein